MKIHQILAVATISVMVQAKRAGPLMYAVA